MKNLFLLLIMIAFAFCTACETKQIKLESKSPEGNTTITVTASRTTSMDPFQTKININCSGFEESASIEVFATDLTNENVTFDWKDNKECFVVFTQQDNTQRKLHIIATKEQILLNE